MKQKETNTIILRFCGYEFLRYTYNGNAVYKLHFVDDRFIYYGFETSPYRALNNDFTRLKNGELYAVNWRRYGYTWKKIAYELEPITEGEKSNEKQFLLLPPTKRNDFETCFIAFYTCCMGNKKTVADCGKTTHPPKTLTYARNAPSEF